MTTAVKVVLGAGSFSRKLAIENLRPFLHEFKDRGHNEIDTARIYGDFEGEKILAELGYKEQGFLLDTKINSWFPGSLNKENLRKSLRDSLTDLRTDRVHILYLHTPDRTVPLEETLGAVNEAYQNGHFDKFGLSNFSGEEVEQAVQITTEKGWVKPTVYQGLYNVVARRGESDLFPVLRKHNIAFYAYSVLGGSFLTDQITKDIQPEQNLRFDPNTEFGRLYRGLFFKDSHFEALEKLKQKAKEHNITVPEIAIRWAVHHSVLSRAHGDGIILGGKTFQRFKDALDFSEKPALPADVLQAIDGVWDIVKSDPAASHS